MLSGEFPRQSDKATGSMFSQALCLLPNLPDGTDLLLLEVFYRWECIMKLAPGFRALTCIGFALAAKMGPEPFPRDNVLTDCPVFLARTPLYPDRPTLRESFMLIVLL